MTSLSRMLPPWTYGFVVALFMWVLISFYAGFGNSGVVLSTALYFAAISVIIGLGQMFVLASGAGNIDLSTPSVLTLTAYISMKVMDGHDSRIVLGLSVALAVGALTGALNFLSISALRLPPIIATLAWSFIFQSLAYNLGGEATFKPPELLADFATTRMLGVPIMPVVVMALTALAGLVLIRGLWGRQLLAVGQSEQAARLAGVPVLRTRLWAYVICAMAAAFGGFVLTGFSGGAALNMGDAYLMESIAVAVLGGTSVAGGRANAIGIWGAALFFNLMASMLNTFHIAASYRLLLMGLIIIGIVSITPQGQRS